MNDISKLYNLLVNKSFTPTESVVFDKLIELENILRNSLKNDVISYDAIDIDLNDREKFIQGKIVGNRESIEKKLLTLLMPDISNPQSISELLGLFTKEAKDIFHDQILDSHTYLNTYKIKHLLIDHPIIFTTDKEIITGSGAGREKKEGYNKLGLLFELLFEIGITTDMLEIIAGTNVISSSLEEKTMLREFPYTIVYVPALDKTILINNSYGEKTFIIDGKYEHMLATIYGDNFSINRTIKQHLDTQGQGIDFDYQDPSHWVIRMKNCLLHDVSGKDITLDITTKAKKPDQIKHSIEQYTDLSLRYQIAKIVPNLSITSDRIDFIQLLRDYFSKNNININLDHLLGSGILSKRIRSFGTKLVDVMNSTYFVKLGKEQTLKSLSGNPLIFKIFCKKFVEINTEEGVMKKDIRLLTGDEVQLALNQTDIDENIFNQNKYKVANMSLNIKSSQGEKNLWNQLVNKVSLHNSQLNFDNLSMIEIPQNMCSFGASLCDLSNNFLLVKSGELKTLQNILNNSNIFRVICKKFVEINTEEGVMKKDIRLLTGDEVQLVLNEIEIQYADKNQEEYIKWYEIINIFIQSEVKLTKDSWKKFIESMGYDYSNGLTSSMNTFGSGLVDSMRIEYFTILGEEKKLTSIVENPYNTRILCDAFLSLNKDDDGNMKNKLRLLTRDEVQELLKNSDQDKYKIANLILNSDIKGIKNNLRDNIVTYLNSSDEIKINKITLEYLPNSMSMFLLSLVSTYGRDFLTIRGKKMTLQTICSAYWTFKIICQEFIKINSNESGTIKENIRLLTKDEVQDVLTQFDMQQNINRQNIVLPSKYLLSKLILGISTSIGSFKHDITLLIETYNKNVQHQEDRIDNSVIQGMPTFCSSLVNTQSNKKFRLGGEYKELRGIGESSNRLKAICAKFIEINTDEQGAMKRDIRLLTKDEVQEMLNNLG